MIFSVYLGKINLIQMEDKVEKGAPAEQNAPATDWFLQLLVRSMDEIEDASIPITLVANGMLVTGRIVSVSKYFRGFAKDFSKDPDVQASMSSFGKRVDPDADKNRPDPQFIHLENARFIIPGASPVPTERGVWWRGKIKDIAGFSVGILANSQS
jgi:hypothetical protein